MARLKEKTVGDSVSTGNLSGFLALMARRRAEEERKKDLEMEFRIEEGTATYDDQLEYLEEKNKWYFKGSAKHQEILNKSQEVEQEKEEIDIQFRYKTGQMNDEELLGIRQEQIEGYTEGSTKYYNMAEEIFGIEKRMNEQDDRDEMQRAMLDYKNNYLTAQEYLDYLNSRMDYMNGEGAAFYTDEERSEMELNITGQEYEIENLNSDMESLTQDIAFKNGVDQLEAGQTYLTELETRLDSERDPIEQIRIQGQITAQQEMNRQIGRDRSEAEYRISFARHEITDEEFHANLVTLMEGEPNPDKKLEYELEAGKYYRQIQERVFTETLQSAKNSYAESQDDQAYLDQLEAMKEEFGADSEFSFQLDSLISPQRRKTLSKEFETALQDVKNDFAKHKNKETYLSALNTLKEEYGEDSIFSFELNSIIAEQEGNLEEAQYNSEMADLNNQLTLGEITQAEYQEAVEGIYDKGEYDFLDAIEFQDKKDSVLASSGRDEMEDLFNSKMAEIQNKYATGAYTDAQYQAALEDMQNNAEAYGYGSLMNIPTYSNKMDDMVAKVTGTNIKKEMQAQIDDIKNRYASKDINYEEYVDELVAVRDKLAEDNPGLYDSYFKPALEAMIADAKGDEITKGINNDMADMLRKYNNHEYDSGPVRNAKGYIADLKELLKNEKYSDPKSDEYKKISDEVSRMVEVKVGFQFDNQYNKLRDAYQKNQTAKGMKKFIKGLNGMKEKTAFSKRGDLIDKIDGYVAELQGDKGVATFKNQLGKWKKQLLNGKIHPKDYVEKMKEIRDKYFGDKATVKIGEEYKDYVTREVQGESNSYLNDAFNRKISDLTNQYQRGEVKANVVREKILKWQSRGSWGTGDFITKQLGERLTDIETEMGEKRFKEFTKEQEKRIQSVQEGGARSYSSKEKEFQDVKSKYQADRASFEEYEASRKKMADYTTKYEDWLSGLKKVELPEFKFEEWKPGTAGLSQLELQQLKL